MIDTKKLNKISDILNSEGGILSLYKDKKDSLYLGSFLKDGSGTIFYSVTPTHLKDYLQSKITLAGLYKSSKSFLIKHKYRAEQKTYLKEEFINDLQCGSDFYKDIPDSMKSESIEKEFGT